MAALAERIRRNLLWLLLPTYLLAYLLPGPGVFAAGLNWGEGLPEAASVRLPMLLVALLLLNAALQVDLTELRGVLQRSRDLLVSVVSVWVGPALVVLFASFLLTFLESDRGGSLLLGMILVAAMPVANSSTGWTEQSGGSLSWALTLVVFSILLCPIVTPGLVRLLGLSLSSAEASSVEHAIHKFSGVTFILWVLAPTITGMLIRRAVGAARIAPFRAYLHLSTSGTILLLNYLNGALVFDTSQPEHTLDTRLLIASVCGACAICLSGVIVAQLVSALLGWSDRERLALKFALSMKHTGLALGLALAVLADHRDALVLILMATPIQHFMAGLVSRRYGLSGEPQEQE